MQIGAQLYTLRDFCTTPEDLAHTLERVAEIGYKTVQLSGTCACPPEKIKGMLDACGLQCVLTHTASHLLQQKTDAVADAHDTLSCEYVGLGYADLRPESLASDYEALVRTYLPVAEKLRSRGKYFMYHNHFREFQRLDGKLVLEHLQEAFAPELMGFTLDTYWVQAAGCDPVQWLSRLSGRVPCIHLKDFAFDKKMAVVGEGNLNFPAIFKAADQAGTKYMLVEQDDCYGEDPFACLERSYRYLHSFGF